MKKIVGLGELLLRLSTKDCLKFSQVNNFNADFGGSELNVLTSIAKFGLPVEFITRLPENDLGESAIMEMKKHSVGTNFIPMGGDRLGLYFLEKGAALRGSKIVYDRAFSSFSTIKKGMIDWKEVFKDANWFHWSGITPGVSQDAADVCMEAIDVANEMGLTVSTDFNYRANLWNYGKSPSEIMTPMVSKCHVVLAGEYASEQYFNIVPEGTTEKEKMQSLCDLLVKQFGSIQKVAITNRGDISASHNTWSAVLYDGKEMHESTTYDITNIVDRIGAGDSFMGALIYGLNTYDDKNALEFAVAASCLKHTIYGDANLVSKKEVENLMGGDLSGRVQR
ncbi:2-dehydro-3-deoxygluconokinase [Pustulibacterium marinum]|uniref:2-dehydro-3-deoxygluconokinase n=1 Tax=Pustulibacterium marinum TaxID=1224947 RepID=A0A1I7EUE0_9FLAO|nr:sugar kinase [Pustulibacterium marinum]SFU27557.1 2-dehydro-3-deoxygluconokinase [Pustulibacterium marinum]